ncbi:hypothetical protein [Thiocystis violacea]|uniref:hypothetical protein n=1 Tax=Thiocystis violacea TaxID=13725 RepID=UPI0019040048|nr:hypothetical protein [Thiocystis violacea]MBK1724499.1 hypothetical protein [Thiocystis violacea]
MPKPKHPRARLSPARDEILVIPIARESVLAGDIGPTLEKLEPLSATREAALKWEGTMTLYFEGWDDDPREISETPEIRAYFSKLTEAWPYWWHYIEKVGETFSMVLCLSCRGQVESVESGMVGWRFEEMSAVTKEVMRLFGGMNRLYERLGLPEANNERVSQEIAELCGCTLLGG